MRQSAIDAEVGTPRFGKYLDRSLSSLAHAAIQATLSDAGIGIEPIQAVWVGTAAAPFITGQAIVRDLGLGRVPVSMLKMLVR